MNILISTIFWGKDYFNNFVDYSLASLLSEHNAPALAREHSVTFVILTENAFIDAFKQKELYKQSCDIVRYEFHALEEYGFNTTRIPSGFHEKKYQFLSVCQNITIELSKNYDVHIFNYADFIWSDGSLGHIAAKFQQNDAFALLGFCVPVDEKTVKPQLTALKSPSRQTITLENHQMVGLALEHLHSEAALRNWNRQHISNFPSYLFWQVGNEGILIRAFHQTLMATAPKKGSKIYNEGIKQGTLDGNFSSEISRVEKTMVANDSEEIFVFSMFSFFVSSEIKKPKEDVLRGFVSKHASRQHLANFQTPFLLKKTAFWHADLWQRAGEMSLRDVAFINECAHQSPLKSDAAVETLDSWTNPKTFSSLHGFILNSIVPRMRHAIGKTTRPVRLFVRHMQAYIIGNMRRVARKLRSYY